MKVLFFSLLYLENILAAMYAPDIIDQDFYASVVLRLTGKTIMFNPSFCFLTQLFWMVDSKKLWDS